MGYVYANASGTFSFDTSGNIAEMSVSNLSGDAKIDVHHSNGFLGLGEDRLVVKRKIVESPIFSTTETAMFFADGSVSYVLSERDSGSAG